MIISRVVDDNYTTEITVAEDSGVRPIYAGQPKEIGGLGIDFRPSQLLLAGLISCTSVNLRHALKQDGIEFDDVIISADLDSSVEGVTIITTNVEIIGDIDEDTKAKYIEESKSCYVRGMLEGEIKVI